MTTLTAGRRVRRLAPRARLRGWLGGEGADAVGSWLTARVLVVGALGLAAAITSKVNELFPGDHIKRVGLLGWDAHFYSDIARVGYGGVSPRDAPLLPAAADARPGCSAPAAMRRASCCWSW